MKAIYASILAFASFAHSQSCTARPNNVFDCPNGSGSDVLSLIQNATENRLILLQAGTFNIPGQAVAPAGVAGVQIVGQGPYATKVVFTQNPATNPPHGFDFSARLSAIRDMSIVRSTPSATAVGVAVILREPESKIENVHISGWLEGIGLLNNNFSLKVLNCRLVGNGTGIYIRSSTAGSANNVTIMDNWIHSNREYGINVVYPDFASTLRILNNRLSNNGRSAIRVESVRGLVINNNVFERNEWLGAGNEASGEDAHILFQENTTDFRQVRHVTIQNNYFDCQYPTSTSEQIAPVTITTTKGTNGTSGLRPWRFKNTPLWNGSTGTRLTQSGNSYLKVNPVEGWDSYACGSAATCY